MSSDKARSRFMASSASNTSDWLKQDFEPWETQQQQQQHARHQGAGGRMGWSRDDENEDEYKDDGDVPDWDSKACKDDGEERLPCQVIVRCRQASTPWEHVVKTVVGNPVHVDVVMAREGTAGAKFCFSSYMNQRFEMAMMDPALIHDKKLTNLSLDITEAEHEKCVKFLTSLEGKASYSYFDALVLLPMAPKVGVPETHECNVLDYTVS